jgi:dCMP deaminase
VSRPSFESIYMRLALALSERSTCARLKVGCVITSTDFRYVYGVGYNGNASGLKNECDTEVVGACGCLHAEENAVINCNSPRSCKKVVFCTNLPCKMCAKRLVNLGGVCKVYYAHDYRLREGLDVLKAAGIEYEQLPVLGDEHD